MRYSKSRTYFLAQRAEAWYDVIGNYYNNISQKGREVEDGKQKNHSGGGEGPLSYARAAEYPAYVCHVRRIRAGAVRVSDQSGSGAVHERSRNTSVYPYYKREGSGVFRIKLCLPCPGRSGHL